MMKTIIAVFLFALSCFCNAQQILINEVLTNNSMTLYDEDGDNPDWIELYNPSDKAIDLSGYGLSDNMAEPFKWKIENYILNAKKYLTILASKKNLQGGKLLPDELQGLMAWFSAKDIDHNDLNQVVMSGTDTLVKKWFSRDKRYYLEQSVEESRPSLVSEGIREYPTVRFDGTRQFLRSNLMPPIGSQPRTIIIMLANVDMDNSNQNLNNYILHYGDYNNAYGLLCQKKQLIGKIGINYWSNSFFSTASMDSKPRFISMVYEDRFDNLYVNGEFAGSNYLTLNTGNKFPLIIASRIGNNNCEFFGGDVAEIMVFDVALSNEQRRQVENYLAENYTMPTCFYHTNFKLDDTGEIVTLTSPDGIVVDQMTIPALSVDHSYGRTNGQYAIFNSPTPGAENGAKSFISQMEPPAFSNYAGFYEEPISLSLTSDDSDAVILYTLDGSIPDINAVNGYEYHVKYDYSKEATNLSIRKSETMIYKTPVVITPKSSQDGDRTQIPTSFLDKNSKIASTTNVTVVRAACWKKGSLRSKVLTHTYFVGSGMSGKYHLPVISVVCPDSALFNYETGIYVPGIYYDQTIGQTTPDANFKQGKWERPAHFELFDKNGNLEYCEDAGIRIHGNFSANWPRKSLRLEAKKKYGTESLFTHPIFPGLQSHVATGAEEIKEYNSFLLRNSGNNWNINLFQDAMAHQLVGHLNCDVQASRAVVHFLNGEYWGIMNLRENFEEQYFSGHYKMDPSQVIIANAAKESINAGYDYEYTDYSAIELFCKKEGVITPENYAYLNSKIDIDNYLTHFMIEIYLNNADFMGNNRKIWKKRTSQYFPDAAFGHDGRWRWILYDLDQTFTKPSFNRLKETTTKENEKSSLILRKLLENENSRNEFINLFCDHMNTTFLPDRAIKMLDSIKVDMDFDIQEHIARWGNIDQNQNYSTIADFIRTRPYYMRKHLKERFDLSDTIWVKVDSKIEEGKVAVNSIKIDKNTIGLKKTTNPYPWDGCYFANVPIRLVGLPKEGYKFSHWSNGETTDTVYISSPSDFSVTAYFKPIEERTDSMIINEINYNSSFIFDAGDWVEFYNPNPYALDVSGWCFKDDNDKHVFVFPEHTKVSASGFLVLCEDICRFTSLYPEVGNYRGNMNFGLGSKGDILRLYDSKGKMVDYVAYKNLAPWPAKADGTGATLELINPTFNNSLAQNWTTSSTKGTPGRINGAVTDINEIHPSKHSVRIHPNPCALEAYIELPKDISLKEKITVRMYNSLGINVWNYECINGEERVLFNRGGLSSGVYIVQIRTECSILQQSVLILK